MEFYKKRDFGTIISDTFLFFKENGKNYFKNYFLLNGLLLILLLVIVSLGYREIFSQVFNSNTEGSGYFFQQYFQNNTGVLISVAGIVFFLLLLISVINYSFPIFYMKRLSETGNKNIKADDILADMKTNWKRLVVLFLGLFFVVSPLALIVVGISYLLILILIGLIILLFVGPTIFNIVNFLLYDFLHTKKGFFESLSYALRSQFSYSHQREKSPYWKYWGSTLIMYIILQVVTSVFTMIPMILLLTSSFTVENKTGELPESFAIIMLVVYTIALMVSLIFSNLIYINAGLLYYDSRTDLHRDQNILEIDSIGANEV